MNVRLKSSTRFEPDPLESQSRLLQVELVLDVEQALPEQIRRKFIIGKTLLYPNEHYTYGVLKKNPFKRFIRMFFAEPARMSLENIGKNLIAVPEVLKNNIIIFAFLYQR